MSHTTNHTEGAKYREVQGMDVKDIAKLIRADLKNCIDAKTSVRIERYAGGRSINVVVYCQDYPDHAKQDVLRQMVREVTDKYNYDNSDVMSDYFSVNFYSNVTFRVKEEA